MLEDGREVVTRSPDVNNKNVEKAFQSDRDQKKILEPLEVLTLKGSGGGCNHPPKLSDAKTGGFNAYKCSKNGL